MSVMCPSIWHMRPIEMVELEQRNAAAIARGEEPEPIPDELARWYDYLAPIVDEALRERAAAATALRLLLTVSGRSAILAVVGNPATAPTADDADVPKPPDPIVVTLNAPHGPTVAGATLAA